MCYYIDSITSYTIYSLRTVHCFVSFMCRSCVVKRAARKGVGVVEH